MATKTTQLTTYRGKRDFARTPEPASGARANPGGAPIFVVRGAPAALGFPAGTWPQTKPTPGHGKNPSRETTD